MDKRNRRIGIFLTAAGCIFFLTGVFTDHWVKCGRLHYGLWNLCKNVTSQNDSIHDIHMNASTSTSTLTSTISTSPFQQGQSEEESEEEEEEEDDDDEEEECGGFSLTEISGAFHVVRALVAFGTILFGYSAACGRVFRLQIVYESSFLNTHKAELVCIVGASAGLVAVSVFKSSFKSFKFNDNCQPELEWSQAFLQVGCIAILIGAFFLMAPTIRQKCSRGRESCLTASFDDFKVDPFGACYRCLFCQQRQSPQSVEPNAEPEEVGLRSYSLPSLNDSFVPENTADSDTDSVIFTVDISNSSLPSRHNHSSAFPLIPNSSYTEPAPRYEDLSPREPEDVPPPPPSYGEAISGLYSTTDTSATASASTHISPLPSAPAVTPDYYEAPPPAYDEAVA